MISRETLNLVRKDLDKASMEMKRSIDWYTFIIEPLLIKYKTNIDGIYAKREWWFILREVK